uniref:Uncharacterized protein n=1 Tax=uncultured bacterium A1Q1_fos_500 TaxID=1256579 RepID=L7VWR2_9BACT|nr:hypothetical protein [uncultured bacterium A1Q1_fos_500]
MQGAYLDLFTNKRLELSKSHDHSENNLSEMDEGLHNNGAFHLHSFLLQEGCGHVPFARAVGFA